MLNRAAPFLLSAGDRVLPLATHMPFFLQRFALQRSLNQVFAQAMQDGLFDILERRWMRLQVNDLNLSWCLSKDPHSNRLLIQERAPVEVTISGNWREFLLLASRQEDPDTLFFRRRLQIDGDTELGLAVKNMIDSLDSDDLPHWLWQTIETLGKQALPTSN
ncbi:MAG: SCP2 sterol-binding domain-containing protein [Thiopseudomonas sp.]|jgi:predicted lipid carrier protein YhbT|nr:SCP2 sterol-binding domain-containing protein [Thiopseudomonas sp.]MBP7958564.1 SCP2 sterol-binding domain-containing protein [Thiopseudomonas sp.]MBP8771405.1 SCP2 sterol-binding domain-containing protein [Thiopseudomonas sp.]